MRKLEFLGQTWIPLPKLQLKACVALREKFKEGYTLADLKADVAAGIVVGMVAIPLGMALAIASGVSPQFGLYTVIIAGTLTALLGGSRFNVTGPTAAFVVVLVPIAQKFGITGLLTAGGMAGILLILLGVTGLGQAIKWIPHPVTTGFTTGIAVVIATIQVKDFLGLTVTGSPEIYLDRVRALFLALPTWSPLEASVGGLTLILLLVWPKINKRIPAPLVVLTLVAAVTGVLSRLFPGFEIATIGSAFSQVIDGVTVHGIPQTLPTFEWPWLRGASTGGAIPLNFHMIKELFPSAMTIAMLGAIETLLCAVVADGMTQTKHNPDSELIALGAANMVCPLFGGIAATGALARTATNIRFGAKSPIAAIIHALFTLGVLLLFAPYVAYLPMASLAALLILVAYNMSEVRHFRHILKVAPRSDVVVLLTCFSLTVIFDMVVGVLVGVILAALLFMRRMAGLTFGRTREGPYHYVEEPLPEQVVLYEVAGPLFFGAVEKAINNLGAITDDIRVIIFDLGNVPVIDVTGLVAFEAAVERMTKRHCHVLIVGLRSQPQTIIKRDKTIATNPHVSFTDSVGEAVEQARTLLGQAAVQHSM